MSQFEMEMVIQETDLDVFGHVNNAAYLRLFENARWEIISNKGIGLKEILRDQVGPVILEVQIRFIKELKARDRIRIVTDFLPFEGKIGVIKQRMVNERDEDCCQADFKIAVFDMKARKIINPPDLWLKLG